MAEEKKFEGRIKELLSAIESMSVLELSELVKALEEKFGVRAQASMASPASATIATPAAEAQEKDTYSVVLTQVGTNKIPVIKEIRAITNLGLKEAKELVESIPKPIKEDASKEEAEQIKKKLEAVGATVELK